MAYRSTTLALLVMAAAAHGQSAKPTVVAYPLDLDPNPALTRFDKELRALYLNELQDRAGVLLPGKKETEHALAETKRQDCREADECLAKLAEKAGTLYAVYAALEYDTKRQLVLSGRVVRDDGKAMGSARVLQSKGEDTIVDVVRVLVPRFFAELRLKELPTFKQVGTGPTIPPPADAGVGLPPPPPPPAVEAPMSTPRAVGWILAGTGAAVGVGGGVVLAVGSASQPVPNPAGQLATEAEVVAFKRAQATQTAGGVLLVAGCAVAVGGLALALLSPAGQSGPTVSVVPLVGGAAISIQGEF